MVQTIKEKQDLMVEENVLKLEVRRLRSILNARADDVFTYALSFFFFSFSPLLRIYMVNVYFLLSFRVCHLLRD
jgi:hypothetical protein